MVRKLLEWAVNSTFVVIVLALASFGFYPFEHVNVT